jgi:hypothetical protein
LFMKIKIQPIKNIYFSYIDDENKSTNN